MDPVKPFFLASFEKEAEAIVARARELARDLTVSAAAEAVRLREEAQREGFERGVTEGREQGRREETRRMCEGVGRVIEEVERHRHRLETEAEHDVVRLAVAIAEKIVKAEVASGKRVTEANVRVALRLAVRGHGLEIRLHPDEVTHVRKAAEDLVHGLQGSGGATFVADPAVSPGGCVVRTAAGTLDFDLKTQLAQLERGLIGA